MKNKNSPELNSRLVKCPKCGKDSLYSTENPYRPFCSERCRLIDLGDWASENYRVASLPDSSSEEEFSEDEEKNN